MIVPSPSRIGDRRGDRARKADVEGLVDLVEQVGVDGDCDRLRCLAGQEREGRQTDRAVVGTCRCTAVGRRVLDEHCLAADRCERDGECRVDRARVAFRDGRVGDRERRRRVLIVDRPNADQVAEAGVQRAREADDELFIALIEHIAVHCHSDRLRRLSSGELKRSAGRHVVGRRGRRGARRGVLDPHEAAADRRERDREGRIDRSRVAFGHRDVVDRERGQRIVVGDRGEALVVGDRRVDPRSQAQR